MKIVHIITTLDPHHGGPPTVATRLAAAQAAIGNDVSVVAYRIAGADERTTASIKVVPGIDRATVHQMPPANRWERLTARLAKRTTLSEVIPTADIVHLHGMWETLLTAAAGIAREARVPYVITPHGMLDPWTLQQKALKKRIALSLGGRKKMLDGAKFLHALNADEEHLLAPLGLKCPLKVIPNGIFLDEVAGIPPTGTFRKKFPQVGSGPYVLFLSRLHYKKGLDILAEAFKHVAASRPDVQLVVAGPDGGERETFLSATAANGLTNRTHVIGAILGSDKLAALNDAACFCLPSRQEGFSMAILEGLACGTPVVITENCHFPEVAQVGAGRVVTLDAKAVADGILNVLSNATIADAMGEKGIALVREQYTWPKVAERAVELYRQ